MKYTPKTFDEWLAERVNVAVIAEEDERDYDRATAYDEAKDYIDENRY